MTRLQATLLGTFALATGDRRPIPIETRKARALLAVLVMAKGQPLRREQLANLLWSRVDTRQSLASLSQALYSLRRALNGTAPDLIKARPDTVALDADLLSADAWELEAAFTEGGEAGQRCCLNLYEGPFLDDLSIDTEEGYAEWRAAERARLEGYAVDGGTALMAAWERAPEAAEMPLVDRLLSIDPYNEPALRVRMLLLARAGRPAAAIEAADAFATLLSTDLGIAPSDALADLAARIRAGAFDDAASNASRPRRPVPALRPVVIAMAGAVLLGAALLWATLAPGPRPDPDIVRLLVRPFDAGDGVAPDLARGFSDDLSTALVRRSDIDVLSRESGRLVADGDEASSGASHVLRGRMRSDEDRWVLNVWITETDGGREIWADRFAGSEDALRAVRDATVTRISEGIGIALTPLPATEPVALPEAAVPAYLAALGRLHSGAPEGNAEAIERLTELAEAHPDAPEPVAGLAIAYERVAFGADDFARAAGLHWLEGYLRLKRELAAANVEHPDILAARSRLALRRLDHLAAQDLARRALDLDSAHVGALAVLSRSLALTGETDAARRLATRAIVLSPAAPEDGYLSLGLAAFADDEMDRAREAVETAFLTARGRPLQLLALRSAILAGADEAASRAAFRELVAALESRPFGAWRMGDVTYENPRAATWRRPTAAEAATLIRFADAAVDARFRNRLFEASGEAEDAQNMARAVPLSGAEIEERLFDRRIAGRRTWLVLQDWTQVRTADGVLFQDGAFGPLPRAREGRSRVVDARLCDRWVWEETEIENCQLVMRDGAGTPSVLVGETGWFPFVTAETGQP
ncbi:BTAD domain-containing putative transcriptional regulator [Psychromarinibacter sp. C21-152]|uniref:BTAD domain-containing putative transcriptional regulator n=1 Tax=Psychromarinibacter sediminicola TaxID=3033385 RepID=A0AAE3T710_9RHOB|nr:BTAD domain-containing putative transcriptional regulator [Psychromarinibacter sediminicola]MDF0599123.1 BTAD domain-containing putative transcriptional regulator [Psychromarinibacter sediminicola]